jgi:hypothetical protein
MVQTVQIGSGATRQFPYYEMTRNGFTFLVMGFAPRRISELMGRLEEDEKGYEKIVTPGGAQDYTILKHGEMPYLEILLRMTVSPRKHLKARNPCLWDLTL